jgi:hypothetical protein
VIDELDRELATFGVPARRRRRIRLEFEDHLACDPNADLGDPRALARQFADGLGTAYARRAGFAVFLALVPVGSLSLLLAALNAGVVNPGAVLGGQLAFVGGMLALLRAWRLRRASVVSAAEATILRRRVALALVGGALTLGSIVVATQRPLALATLGVGVVALAGAAAAWSASFRTRPFAAGEPGDLSFDLGVDADPWRLALWIAGAVALCIAVAGVVQADPFDGLARGLADGVLCLLGFAVLGRPLGLRKSRLP